MMNNYTLVILLAGRASRMNQGINKAFIKLDYKTVLAHNLDTFLKVGFKDIVLVYNKQDQMLLEKELLNYPDINFIKIEGGNTRSESVHNALKEVHSEYVLLHDCARPFVSVDDVKSLMTVLEKNDAVSLYHDVVDAIKYKGKSINKNELKAVTTPQGFNKKTYEYILNNYNSLAQDELEVIEDQDFKIEFIKETKPNTKLTFESDLKNQEFRIGHSMDFHAFEPKEYLVLGGVKIPSTFGLKGHSDADCVYHAICESILGALSLNDIGTLYPDNDNRYKGIDSSFFLKEANKLLKQYQYEISNIDVMIFLERPKLKDYKEQMRKNISQLLEIDINKVCVKATTYEQKGVIGSSEGIQAESIVLIKKVSY